MTQGQEKKLDTVIQTQKTEADKRLDKRIDEVFGGSVKSLPKGKFVKEEGVKKTADFVSDQLAIQAEKEIEAAKAKGSFEAAQTEIRIRHKKGLGELYNRVISILKLSGGKNQIIDDEQELINTSGSAITLIKSINLAEMMNTANGKIIYEGAHEENKGIFETIEKLANKKTLTEKDYEYLADKLVSISGMKIELDKMTDMEKSFSAIRQTTIFSAIMFLSAGQRFEVAKKLVDRHGDKGIGIISELVKVRIFTIVQMDELLKYSGTKISSKKRGECMKLIREGTYAKAQEDMDKLNERAKTDLKKLFHTGFAQDSLTYKNVLFWEVGRYLLIGTALLNFIVNAKNKDVGGVLFNIPMWASIAGTAYIYNDVTKGGLQQKLGKRSKVEQKAYENQERTRKFEEKFTRYPQLAKWFIENLDRVNDGFENVNPKHDPKATGLMTFAKMRVKTPSEKDGRRGGLLEQTISEWHKSLYFDLNKMTVKEQRDYLQAVLSGQTEVNQPKK